jgi:hypothetical protein
VGDIGGIWWVGGKSFKSKRKRNRVWGREKIKLQKKKLRSGLRKGKEPGMIAWGWEPDEKHPNLIAILPI